MSSLFRTSLKASLATAGQASSQICMNNSKYVRILFHFLLSDPCLAWVLRLRQRIGSVMGAWSAAQILLTFYCDFQHKNPQNTPLTMPQGTVPSVLYKISANLCSFQLSCLYLHAEPFHQEAKVGKIHPHTLGMVLFLVIYLFSSSFTYGLVLLQFCHLFSIQLNSFHDPFSLCSTGTEPSVTKHSSCPTGQTQGEAKGLTWSIPGHPSQKITSIPDHATALITSVVPWGSQAPSTFPSCPGCTLLQLQLSRGQTGLRGRDDSAPLYLTEQLLRAAALMEQHRLLTFRQILWPCDTPTLRNW